MTTLPGVREALVERDKISSASESLPTIITYKIKNTHSLAQIVQAYLDETAPRL